MTNVLSFSSVIEYLLGVRYYSYSGFAILDCENATQASARTGLHYILGFFAECRARSMYPILVGKCAHIARFLQQAHMLLPSEPFYYFFLHGNNKKCPDDCFIVEMQARFTALGQSCLVYTNDRFANRMTWSKSVTDAMISSTDNPTRPRVRTHASTVLYRPNFELIDTSVPQMILLDHLPRIYGFPKKPSSAHGASGSAHGAGGSAHGAGGSACGGAGGSAHGGAGDSAHGGGKSERGAGKPVSSVHRASGSTKLGCKKRH
uniref:Uncharacterized protein n=1 Tax=viral metagenome TaxID=1070528 RepID=A0A6C0H0M4_9ZZZZ